MFNANCSDRYETLILVGSSIVLFIVKLKTEQKIKIVFFSKIWTEFIIDRSERNHKVSENTLQMAQSQNIYLSTGYLVCTENTMLEDVIQYKESDVSEG